MYTRIYESDVMIEKYGDVFTFILFGRRMTVALGERGNNFVTGGKVAHLSAEEAYTVCVCLGHTIQVLTDFLS